MSTFIRKSRLTRSEDKYYSNLNLCKDDYDTELLQKLDIPFNDESNIRTSSMSVMALASALPDSVDSTGDTKSCSDCDYEATSFDDDADYSQYDFEHDEDEIEGLRSNAQFNFKICQSVIDGMKISEAKKYKNGTRSSLTFSNQRVKEIERDNRILLQKIMRNGPAGDILFKNKSANGKQRSHVKSAAEINRQRKQQQIYYENQLLKRKLDKIASRQASISS